MRKKKLIAQVIQHIYFLHQMIIRIFRIICYEHKFHKVKMTSEGSSVHCSLQAFWYLVVLATYLL